MSDSPSKLNPVQINSVRIMVNQQGMLKLDRYIKMDDKDACLRLINMTVDDIKKLL